jgi:hypothetical protein
MRILMITILCFSFALIAAPRIVVEKIIKADTIYTTKLDTIRLITYDTIKITKTIQDTVIVKKSDTTYSKSKPVHLK